MSSRQSVAGASGGGVSVVEVGGGGLETGGLMPSRVAVGWRFRVRDWQSQLEEDWLSLAWTVGSGFVSLTVDLDTLEGYLTRDSTEVGVLEQRTNVPVCFTSVESWELLR